ncbi:hypothetical protein QBC40DRAFT_266875 [Triangularia verruculosa]|uniref:Uncharacterized protein n=1 Tax=Triangularia verruculosa TaxID=2587418 RepID=A0AAN6XGU5_9PEZI|nr:hypothetical protein QBC40DRAFT_266875 [Triangularia verruculosa]
MQIKTFFALLTAVTAASAATRPKANEYTDTNCQNWNYGHNSFELGDVTMDDTSNSVYITHGQRPDGVRRWFFAYDGKTGNGGSCTGNRLTTSSSSVAPSGCVNLNTAYPGKRIRCLRSVSE